MYKYHLNNKLLQELLIETKKEHIKYEQELGHTDKDWTGWYADYIMKKLESLALIAKHKPQQ